MEKVSLILTTFNSKDNLIQTLESIEKQDYPLIEVVIKDGGSGDGTLEVIREYQMRSRYDVVWQSKPDTGIYDAMNQGYSLSSGDIIVFFNDKFINSAVITRMIQKIDEINPKTGRPYIGCHADLIYADGDRIVRRWCMGKGNIYQGWMPGHPTLFLRKEVYEKYGLYETSYRISADYEFMIRFLKDQDNQLNYLPETIISMYYGGTSNGGISNYLLSLKEGHRALKNNHIKGAFFIDVKRIIRVVKQFMV